MCIYFADTSIDTQISECLDTMRPTGLTSGATYSVPTLGQILYNGTVRYNSLDGTDSLDKFSVGAQNGFLCTLRLFNPGHAGFHYQMA